MKVLQDNLVNIDKEARYVRKKCGVCDSILDINNGDVLSKRCSSENEITMKCPCCGSTFTLYKYFQGRIYSVDQYSEVAAKYAEDVYNIMAELDKISIGYGNEYFNLGAVGIVGTETVVSIVVYIDEYEEGNWEKLLKRNVYFKRLDLDIPSKILCDTFRDYAKYAQALFDYVKHELASYHPYEECSSIVACLRGGDFGSMVNVGDKNYKLSQQKSKEDKTIYTPDIKDGLEYVGGKIERGALEIENGLFSIACAIHNFSLMESESVKKHSVEVYGHVLSQ